MTAPHLLPTLALGFCCASLASSACESESGTSLDATGGSATGGDGPDPGGAENGSGSSDSGGGTGGRSGGGSGGANLDLPDTCVFPEGSALESALLPEGYCAFVWASDLVRPRGIIVDENGDVLVADEDRIVLLHDDDENGVSDASERVELVTQNGLNHGIAISDGYLYASTPTTVYRWPYAADRQALTSRQEVVTGIPGGGHVTRSLLFDAVGRLYVSVGSGSNLDDDSSRARLIRYPAADLDSTSTFEDGELFADGLRNEVGLALDAQGRVWGVENGRDNLARADLGGDIHNDNPGEELNLFLEENVGRFYGYPYCWSEGSLAAGDGPGTQWADPDNTTHDDAWCKDPDNVIPPVLSMQAHSAPLALLFYDGGALPLQQSAIITFHGSWNRSTETGYKVVHVPLGTDGMPSGPPTPLLESENPGDRDADWPHRPVGLAIAKNGSLLVTSDASGLIIAVGNVGSL